MMTQGYADLKICFSYISHCLDAEELVFSELTYVFILFTINENLTLQLMK